MLWLIAVVVLAWPILKGALKALFWLEERTGCLTVFYWIAVVAATVTMLWCGYSFGGWGGLTFMLVLVGLYWLGTGE